MYLFLLFLAVPLIEIALFIQVGGIIGLWPTLAVVILTALLGTAMIRSQGASALNDIKRSIEDMRDPSGPLAHGAMILFSGALLLTPGFFTDTVGFLLLIPGFRNAVISYVRKRVSAQSYTIHARSRQPQPGSSTVIEGEYHHVNPGDEPQNRGDSGWTRH